MEAVVEEELDGLEGRGRGMEPIEDDEEDEANEVGEEMAPRPGTPPKRNSYTKNDDGEPRPGTPPRRNSSRETNTSGDQQDEGAEQQDADSAPPSDGKKRVRFNLALNRTEDIILHEPPAYISQRLEPVKDVAADPEDVDSDDEDDRKHRRHGTSMVRFADVVMEKNIPDHSPGARGAARQGADDDSSDGADSVDNFINKRGVPTFGETDKGDDDGSMGGGSQGGGSVASSVNSDANLVRRKLFSDAQRKFMRDVEKRLFKKDYLLMRAISKVAPKKRETLINTEVNSQYDANGRRIGGEEEGEEEDSESSDDPWADSDDDSSNGSNVDLKFGGAEMRQKMERKYKMENDIADAISKKEKALMKQIEGMSKAELMEILAAVAEDVPLDMTTAVKSKATRQSKKEAMLKNVFRDEMSDDSPRVRVRKVGETNSMISDVSDATPMDHGSIVFEARAISLETWKRQQERKFRDDVENIIKNRESKLKRAVRNLDGNILDTVIEKTSANTAAEANKTILATTATGAANTTAQAETQPAVSSEDAQELPQSLRQVLKPSQPPRRRPGTPTVVQPPWRPGGSALAHKRGRRRRTGTDTSQQIDGDGEDADADAAEKEERKDFYYGDAARQGGNAGGRRRPLSAKASPSRRQKVNVRQRPSSSSGASRRRPPIGVIEEEQPIGERPSAAETNPMAVPTNPIDRVKAFMQDRETGELLSAPIDTSPLRDSTALSGRRPGSSRDAGVNASGSRPGATAARRPGQDASDGNGNGASPGRPKSTSSTSDRRRRPPPRPRRGPRGSEPPAVKPSGSAPFQVGAPQEWGFAHPPQASTTLARGAGSSTVMLRTAGRTFSSTVAASTAEFQNSLLAVPAFVSADTDAATPMSYFSRPMSREVVLTTNMVMTRAEHAPDSGPTGDERLRSTAEEVVVAAAVAAGEKGGVDGGNENSEVKGAVEVPIAAGGTNADPIPGEAPETIVKALLGHLVSRVEKREATAEHEEQPGQEAMVLAAEGHSFNAVEVEVPDTSPDAVEASSLAAGAWKENESPVVNEAAIAFSSALAWKSSKSGLKSFERGTASRPPDVRALMSDHINHVADPTSKDLKLMLPRRVETSVLRCHGMRSAATEPTPILKCSVKGSSKRQRGSGAAPTPTTGNTIETQSLTRGESFPVGASSPPRRPAKRLTDPGADTRGPVDPPRSTPTPPSRPPSSRSRVSSSGRPGRGRVVYGHGRGQRRRPLSGSDAQSVRSSRRGPSGGAGPMRPRSATVSKDGHQLGPKAPEWAFDWSKSKLCLRPRACVSRMHQIREEADQLGLNVLKGKALPAYAFGRVLRLAHELHALLRSPPDFHDWYRAHFKAPSEKNLDMIAAHISDLVRAGTQLVQVLEDMNQVVSWEFVGEQLELLRAQHHHRQGRRLSPSQSPSPEDGGEGEEALPGVAAIRGRTLVDSDALVGEEITRFSVLLEQVSQNLNWRPSVFVFRNIRFKVSF